MKHTKKLTGVLLALVMALSLVTTAFAEDSYTITAPTDNTHTYEIYQIFTGDLHEKVLSNVKWGENGTGTKGQAVSETILEELAGTTGSDTAKLAVISKYVNLDSDPIKTVGGKTDADAGTTRVVSVNVEPGYYLIKDVDGALDGENDSYTLYLVKVVGNVTIAPKSDVPEVEKKVKDINDSTDTDKTGWQDSADHDIGDDVDFQLKATLADNVSSYTTYKVVFHDTLSKGLTYNNDAKVYIDGEETDGFTVTSTVNGDGTTTLTASCDDVKALDAGNSSVITVEYTATLNDKAVIGSAGNPNEVYLEYSNNPNKSEEGDNETGNTPKDTVIVFTYKTIINKVTKNPAYDPTKDEDKDGTDSEGHTQYIPLEGAEFTLEKYYKETDEWKPIAVVKNDEGTTFTFSGLDDGDYRLTETTTPAGYNTIDPIEFTITAEHEIESDNPALKSLNGNATTGEITFTANTTDGSLSADVVNNAGATLPETGGIGTTIFYIAGSVLVLAAVVLLVTKKRMNSSDK